MKKLSILIVIMLLALGLYYFFTKDSKPSAVVPGGVSNNAFHPDPSSATFTFDGNAVTLSRGKGVTTDAESGESEETTLLEERAYGDINNDDKDDTIAFISQSGGGSGVFIYVAAYVSGPVNYKGTNAVFLGDRIAPESISFNNGIATVRYLDRGPDEPFAAEPTIQTSKQLVYKNGQLQEK